MKAVVFDRFGGPEVLRVEDIPAAEPGPGQVRVRVHGATVNPTDTLFRAGRRPFDPAEEPPPWTPGQELAGIVEAVGKGVTEWQAGERVAAVTRPAPGVRGAQSELAVVFADSIAAVPRDVSLLEAATLPMNGLTARQAVDLTGAGPGGTILVTGAAGAVGGYAVQLARHAGMRVIATASEADRELVRALGADVVVDPANEVVAAVREEVSGGVDAVVDAALIGSDVSGAVRDGGCHVSLRGPLESEPDRGIRVESVSVARDLHGGKKLERLMGLVGTGDLTLRVAAALQPEEVGEAHRRIEAGRVRGRMVLVFDDGDR